MVEAHPPRVLLIDDDPNLREIVSALLAAFGSDFQGAADGQSGLALFDSEEWDLVLVDLARPEVSAWEVVETIRHRAPTTPLVLLLGLSDPVVLRRARDCGVRVLAKPFYVQTLKAALAEALSAQLA